MLGGRERSAEERLVDVAEANVVTEKLGQGFGLVPTFVADLDYSWILDELAEKLVEIFAVETGVLERDGKLDQQRSEHVFGGQRFEAFTGQALVLLVGSNA